MARIIHLTDFHLNPNNLKDWKNHVKKVLLSKLQIIHTQKPITFIAFTGDMIDEGGRFYSNSTEALNIFNAEIIQPIINLLSLNKNQFIFIPGNHDIVRSKDKEREELGNIEYFKDSKNISKYISDAISNNDFSGMLRIQEFKEFEKIFYSEFKTDYLFTIFGSAFKLTVNGEIIGVCCLNSAWRCYGKNDKEKLLIGEEQLAKCTSFIEDCTVKIALMHHPLDWLSIAEQSVITSHINKDFDILLVGHVHENMTSVHTGLNNSSLFTNVAPSGLNDIRSDSRSFANGFTVIDFNKTQRKIYCEYLRYNHLKTEFVLNTDIGDEGIFYAEIPDIISSKDISLINTVLSHIREDHFKEMDNHLLGQKAEKVPVSIKEAFILPPIDQGNTSKSEGENEVILEISEVVKSKFNFMFFGNQETGKTTLLYRLTREFVDEYDYLGKIPVYLDFDEIGNKEIQTCIREYLGCGSKDVVNLLENGLIVLLLDNLNYKKNDDSQLLKRIDQFFNEWNKNEGQNKKRELRIISAAVCEISGILPTDYIDICKIPFKNYFIRSFKTKGIKKLMKLWLPGEEDLQSEQRLDKLVSGFNSFALPSTAMSVSLFLWSMENKDKKPINHAVLLEIYIEILLEKLAKENIYREKFDFTNKVQLLAKIAEEMLAVNQPNFSILFSDFVKIIEKYLDAVGFDFEASKIVDYLLERKLFVKHQVNRVKFTYSCYFHFFIAKRMVFNKEFKDYVMQVDTYFKFHKEIDYYTALTRSDKEIFEQILSRFEERFKPTDFIIDKINEKGIDDYFTPKIQSKPQESIAKNVEINTIKENRPSEEMMEKFQDIRLNAIPEPGTILKKEGDISLDVLLVIMANVLRNSEGVEDRKLKKKAYDLLIKYSLVYMVIYKQYLIDYVLKNKKLPPAIPFELSLKQLLIDIPYYVQLGMFHHTGTAKLGPIILEKIKEDIQNKSFTGSDIESYLSVALYSDVQGKDYHKYFKSLIKRLRNNIVRDFSFYKLTEYYYKRTKPGSPKEAIYLDLLAELRIKTQNLPRRLKERIIKSLEDGKIAFQSKLDL